MKKSLKCTLLFVPLTIIMMSCSIDTSLNEMKEDYHPSIDLSLSQQTDWPMAIEILNLINNYRLSIGLSKIKVDYQLASAYAVSHTKYMIEKNELNHDNFQIRSKGMINSGALLVSENVAFGYNNPESVVNAWINSPSHKSVIEGNYTHSGFGILKDTNGKYYFTQLFYKME
ncbi:MAG: CAP domain-containing protein [Flavobacteriaceae bacterium]